MLAVVCVLASLHGVAACVAGTSLHLAWDASLSSNTRATINNDERDAVGPAPGGYGLPAQVRSTELPAECARVSVTVNALQGNAHFGVTTSSGDEFWLDASSCCLVKDAGVCLPRKACNAETLELEWHPVASATGPTSARLLLVTPAQRMDVFGTMRALTHTGTVKWRLTARMWAGASVHNLTAESCADRHRDIHEARGAKCVQDRGRCGAGQVECGGQCFWAQECMCYANGIHDQDGVRHKGAHCLTQAAVDGEPAQPHRHCEFDEKTRQTLQLIQSTWGSEHHDAIRQASDHADNLAALHNKWSIPVVATVLRLLQNATVADILEPSDGSASASNGESQPGSHERATHAHGHGMLRGATVTLAGGAPEDGCLHPGAWGVVIDLDDSLTPVKVRCPSGTTQWYKASHLRVPDAGPGRALPQLPSGVAQDAEGGDAPGGKDRVVASDFEEVEVTQDA